LRLLSSALRSIGIVQLERYSAANPPTVTIGAARLT